MRDLSTVCRTAVGPQEELEGLNEQQMSGVAVAYSEAGYASWAELVIGPEKGGDGSIWA